ncbi:hypothetical protein YC2023_112823 [Brassica napus]
MEPINGPRHRLTYLPNLSLNIIKLTRRWWSSGVRRLVMILRAASSNLPLRLTPTSGHPGPPCYFWGGNDMAAAGLEGCLDPGLRPSARRRKSFELLYKIEWLTRTTLTTSLHPISTTDYILIENSSSVTDTLTEGV